MSNMNADSQHSLRFKRIDIENYKGIDTLSLVFPSPMLKNDPDILVMGSENGVGKTSILECCALILICLKSEEKEFKLPRHDYPVNLSSCLVKAGAESAKIQAEIAVDEGIQKAAISINSSTTVKITAPEICLDWIDGSIAKEDMILLIKGICGFFPNPIVKQPLLFFHSYRQVKVGAPNIALMVNSIETNLRMTPNISSVNVVSDFKLLINKLFISKENRIEFEGESEKEHKRSLNKLKELTVSYAGGDLEKIRFLKDNRADVIFKADDGGNEISIDGLSSGEKEIISTLFMIWHYTRDSPSIVLIDEPELHLNAQWHRRFINDLTNIAPHNQYVIATHSEYIMDSAATRHRALLKRTEKNNTKWYAVSSQISKSISPPTFKKLKG